MRYVRFKRCAPMSMLKRRPGKWEKTPTHGQKLAKGGIPGNHTKCKIGEITGGINRCPASGQEEKNFFTEEKKNSGGGWWLLDYGLTALRANRSL